MKSVILFFCAAIGFTASADQFKTVKEVKNTPAYDYSASYPQLLQGSVPAYATINQGLKKNIDESACDPAEATADRPFSFDLAGTVAALNQAYVTVRMSGGSDCGGAHPNTWTYYLTFNSKTGELLDLPKEFGFQKIEDPNFDFEKDNKLRLKLAKILLTRIPKDSDVEECFGKTDQEKLDNLTTFFPNVAGLGKNKTVVLAIDPPHVAAVCYFDARVSYDVVKELLVPGSYLNTWLRK